MRFSKLYDRSACHGSIPSTSLYQRKTLNMFRLQTYRTWSTFEGGHRCLLVTTLVKHWIHAVGNARKRIPATYDKTQGNDPDTTTTVVDNFAQQ